MNITFEGKTALITGATSGIGEATARELAGYGCCLMITGRNESKLRKLREALHENHHNIESLSGDVADETFCQELVTKTTERFNRLDVLVNSAGIIQMDTIENVTLEKYDQLMNINLRSALYLMQLCLPHLERTKGSIVNVSSVAGVRSFPGILSYCISKAGMDQLTRCAALELAGKGIRVNAVNPGVVETKLHLNSGMARDKYDKFLEHSKTTHPLGRVGQPEEVAHLIAFLASDAAGWITGATCGIDGGRAQTCAR